jgi:hypothetical protein
MPGLGDRQSIEKPQRTGQSFAMKTQFHEDLPRFLQEYKMVVYLEL